MEAADAQRAEAIRKLEDVKPLLAGPTGASSEAPSGVLAWEGLAHYHERSVKPLETDVAEIRREVQSIRDAAVTVQEMDDELIPIVSRFGRAEYGLEEMRQTTEALRAQMGELRGQGPGHGVTPIVRVVVSSLISTINPEVPHLMIKQRVLRHWISCQSIRVPRRRLVRKARDPLVQGLRGPVKRNDLRRREDYLQDPEGLAWDPVLSQ